MIVRTCMCVCTCILFLFLELVYSATLWSIQVYSQAHLSQLQCSVMECAMCPFLLPRRVRELSLDTLFCLCANVLCT